MIAFDEEWFRDWFNTGYYHLLYANRDEEEAGLFLDNLLERFNLPRGSRVLDLACGKGRHSFHLARNGMVVTGLDLSEESIECALKENVTGTEFYVHDMRFPFRVNYFDAVLSLFSSFGYFKSERENRNALRSGVMALKPGGLYVLDFMNAEKVERELIDYEEKEVEGVHFTLRRLAKNGFITKQIDVKHGDISRQYTEAVRAYSKEELTEMFAAENLEIIDVFGDYQLAPFNRQESDRLIIAGIKKQS